MIASLSGAVENGGEKGFLSGKDYSTLAELQVQDPANLSHHEHKWQLGPERQSSHSSNYYYLVIRLSLKDCSGLLVLLGQPAVEEGGDGARCA